MVDQLYSVSSTSSSPPFSVTLFDRRRTFGGVWSYDPSPGPCVIRYDRTGRPHALWSASRKDGDEHGLFRPPGPMYDGLRTNLPCDVMAYRSSPYPAKTHLFPDRRTVEEYVQEFADKVVEKAKRCGLDLRLGTAVSDVRRIQHSEREGEANVGAGSRWQVASASMQTGDKREEVYDHIVLASGRCNTPMLPRISGLRHFTGEILHSAWWRSPLPFQHKTVLVVGNSSSGSDIARELSGYILRTLPEGKAATEAFVDKCNAGEKDGKVLHSYEHFDKPPPLDYDPRDEGSPVWAKRITVLPKITRIEPVAPTSTETGKDARARIHFDNGDTRDDVDVIIFATGYAYDFPYLPQSLAPFDTHPLIPTSTAPPQEPTEAGSPGNIGEQAQDKDDDDAYVPPHPTASYLSNLDDWSLFYARDPSICVLGAPIRIVPMPLTHVQARIVAASWAGQIGPLPHLRDDIPTTDPTKWTSFAAETASQDKRDEKCENKTSDLGYPSDTAYQNALLNLLPPELRPRGGDEARTVPPSTQAEQQAEAEEGKEKVEENDQVGVALQPVTAQDDGWARMPDYRNQRRQDTKRLRRLMLGY